MRSSASLALLMQKEGVLFTLCLFIACKSEPSGACVSQGCSDPERCEQPICYNVQNVNDCQVDAESRPFEFIKDQSCNSLGYQPCEDIGGLFSNAACSGNEGGSGGIGGSADDGGEAGDQALSTGACCEAHGDLGCSELSVQACVCAQDRFCCTSGWDAVCVEKAEELNCISCSE